MDKLPNSQKVQQSRKLEDRNIARERARSRVVQLFNAILGESDELQLQDDEGAIYQGFIDAVRKAGEVEAEQAKS